MPQETYVAEGDGIVVYAGTYDALDDAQIDFDLIKDAHRDHWIGTYDAALFEKTFDGKVKVIDTDATQRVEGAGIGLIVGAVIGLLFPIWLVPAAAAGAALGSAALGSAFGAVIGDISKGFSRKDVKELGEQLDGGTSGIVLVADETFDVGAERLFKHAKKMAKKRVDADAKELKREIDAA